MKRYPIQVITFDEVSHRAVDMAEIEKFDSVSKVEPKQLSSAIIEDYHQILVLEKPTEETIHQIAEQFETMNEPIAIVPDAYRESEEVKNMLLMGIGVILCESEPLTSLSLANMLNKIDLVFYTADEDADIRADHEDIYEVLGRGTLIESYEESGSDVSAVTLSLFNDPKGFKDAYGAYIIFEVHEDLPALKIAEAMEIAEGLIGEDAFIIFATRTNQREKESVKVSALISRLFNFKIQIQEAIDESTSYLSKASVIVDEYAKGTIDNNEADMMAKYNNIEFDDLKSVYNMAYEIPFQIVRAMRRSRDKSVSQERREEAMADLLMESDVDADILEEIALSHHLSIENILEIVKLKNDDKLPLIEVRTKLIFKDNQDNIRVGQSSGVPVLVFGDQVKQVKGMDVVEADDLRIYEKDGNRWYVSKGFDDEKIDKLVGEYDIEEGSNVS